MEKRIKLFERRRRKELSHKCGVYAIFVNGHIYVGSSEDLSRRLSEHRMDIPKKGRGCRVLHSLYEEFSKDAFYYAIVEYCTPEERLMREKYYIEVLNADCNTAKDPQNPITHNTAIYRYDNNGKYLCSYSSVTDAARKVNGSEGNISTAASQHRYAYNSLWSFRKELRYPFIPKTKLKTKRVYMFDSTTLEYIRDFVSISDAARFVMSSNNKYNSFDSLCNMISYHCSKQHRHDYNGYFFSYKDNLHTKRQ